MGKDDSQKETSKELENKPKCGIVMPISEIDGLSPAHWIEVLELVQGSAKAAGFHSDLVSVAEFSGIIQQRIVQNLYSNELVICDVSGQNPNVMFELGLRLAFDKATIVIVDDRTRISFDTSPIEHLIYPRDLRHGKIVEFTKKLTEMINATYKESQKDDYSTFLKHFGKFDVKGLKEKEGGIDGYVVSMLEQMSSEITTLKLRQDSSYGNTIIKNTRKTLTDEQSLSSYVVEALVNLRISEGEIGKDNIDYITDQVHVFIRKNRSILYSNESIRSVLIKFIDLNEVISGK